MSYVLITIHIHDVCDYNKQLTSAVTVATYSATVAAVARLIGCCSAYIAYDTISVIGSYLCSLVVAASDYSDCRGDRLQRRLFREFAV